MENYTWLLAAIFGVALKLSVVKPLSKETIIRAFIQGMCVGFFANDYCNNHDLLKEKSFITGGAALLAEFIIQLIIKNKWVLLKNKTGLDMNDEKGKD